MSGEKSKVRLLGLVVSATPTSGPDQRTGQIHLFGRLAGNDGRVRAILRLDGDSHQSFREYR